MINGGLAKLRHHRTKELLSHKTLTTIGPNKILSNAALIRSQCLQGECKAWLNSSPKETKQEDDLDSPDTLLIREDVTFRLNQQLYSIEATASFSMADYALLSMQRDRQL